MATLARIRATGGDNKLNSGLYGLSVPVDSPVLFRKGHRVRSAFGPVSPTGAKAARTVGSSTSAVTLTAVEGGTWANNQITYTQVMTGSNARSLTKTYNYGVAQTTVTTAASGSDTSLTVASTAVVGSAGTGGFQPAFPSAGTIYVGGLALTYTGTTGTTFTGITALTTAQAAAITANSIVKAIVPVSIDIVYTAKTSSGTADATETAQAVVAQINADPELADLVVASYGSTGLGLVANGTKAALSTGSDKTFGDGKAYLEPLYVRASIEKGAIVDLDDRKTSRFLRRNKDKIVSLGLVANGVASL